MDYQENDVELCFLIEVVIPLQLPSSCHSAIIGKLLELLREKCTHRFLLVGEVVPLVISVFLCSYGGCSGLISWFVCCCCFVFCEHREFLSIGKMSQEHSDITEYRIHGV